VSTSLNMSIRNLSPELEESVMIIMEERDSEFESREVTRMPGDENENEKMCRTKKGMDRKRCSQVFRLWGL
jgi:hypothetical protein